MDDLNRDIRIAWERDYSHLITETESIIGKRDCFRYKGYEFYLANISNTLFVTEQHCSAKRAWSDWIDITFDELKSKYFSDILNPTQNELVLFELEYGFEWPFQEKNKTANQRSN